MRERYTPKEIIKNKEAPVKHFIKEPSSNKDRFGNQLYVSKELAYLDGVEEEVKAGVLISREGQTFIANNPGILKDLDRGLALLDEGKSTRKRMVELGESRTLREIVRGGQSYFYILEVGSEKYAIKTHAPRLHIDEPDLHQPYINEMLQTQSVATDLKENLAEMKIRLSTFLFASGQVSCTRFEEDEKNLAILEPTKIIPRLYKLYELVSDYLSQDDKQKDPLWERVEVDLPLAVPGILKRILTNFITKSDGTLVWIDPFLYYRKRKS